MSTKQVLDRQKAAGAVLSAGQSHGDIIGQRTADALRGHLKKGEGLPDAGMLVALLTRALAADRDAMVAADQAHEVEQSDDLEPRNRRDEASATLATEVADLRDWATALFGADQVSILGIRGATPSDPVALERYTGEIVHALETATLPPLKRKGVKWDPSDAIARMSKARAELKVAMRDVAREVREAQVTRSVRNTAIERFDERYRRSASLLVGLLRYVGEDELADRVRPNLRRAAAEAPEAAPAAGNGGPAPADA